MCSRPGWVGTAAVIVIATFLMLLVSCGDSSRSAPTYDAAVQEGQTAAEDLLREGRASALTIALTDRSRIIWSETFGLADREAGRASTAATMFGVGSVSKMFATIAA